MIISKLSAQVLLAPILCFFPATHTSEWQSLQIQFLVASDSKQIVKDAWEIISKTVSQDMQQNFEKARKITRKHQTVASRLLDLELDLYPVTEKHYAIVDGLIDQVESDLAKERQSKKWKRFTPRQRSLKTFRIIDKNIKRVCFVKYEKSQGLLSGAITQKLQNCHTLTTLYVAIGEALNLPIVAVSVPNHIFVRWNLANGKHVNWETTSSNSFSDSYYYQDLPEKTVVYSAKNFHISYQNQMFWTYNDTAKQTKDESSSTYLGMKKFFIPKN